MHLIARLSAKHPLRTITPNNNGKLPLQLAMQAGQKFAVCALVLAYPEAVFQDDSMDDIMLVEHDLRCLMSRASTGIHLFD